MYIKPKCNENYVVELRGFNLGEWLKRRQRLSSRNMHNSVDYKLLLSHDLALKFDLRK